jgi:general secretion pathway protein A
MYLSFFGLHESPFSLAPDPRFLLMARSHRDVFTQLLEQRGVVVLTGEPGTGKTALLLALRERLGAETAVSYVFNTTLGFDDIVEYLLDDLGIAKPEESPARRLDALTSFLSERERAGQRTTLIVDEAQHLDASTLAQLAQLASLERESPSRLLQILLVGPPELESALDHPDLGHLRAAARCRLGPLGIEEVEEYIRHRLAVAGAPDTALFDRSAIGRIAQFSGGLPRVINILGDRCLLFAYADHEHHVDRGTARRAIADLAEPAWAPSRVLRATWAGLTRRLRRRRG